MDHQFIVMEFDGQGLPVRCTVWAERTPAEPQRLAQWAPEPFDRPQETLATAIECLTIQGSLL